MPVLTNQKPASKKTVKRAKKKIIVKKKPADPPTLTRTGKRAKPTRSPEERAEIRARQQKALELRMAGTPYADIARALGYANPSSAKKACDSAMSRVTIDAAKEVVAMDLARLDEFQMRCTHALRNNGDLGQIDRILRIMDWRYRLLGVNDETVRALQSEHGIHTTTNVKNQVMVVQAAPETSHDFISKMMKAVGVDPNSDEAQTLLRQYNLNEAAEEEGVVRALPMLEGSANSDRDALEGKERLAAEDIVEGEIVE